MNKIAVVTLFSLCTAGTVHAAQGITFPYQKHYACTWVFTGTPQEAPDLYTAVNARSGAMSLQRAGAQVYYAKKVTDDIWQEINPMPNQDAEDITVKTDGMLETYQGNTKISSCIEVE